MRGHSRRSAISPALVAAILTIIGTSLLLMLVYNLPAPNGPDRDQDGISDNFQSVHPVKDVIKDGDGWKVETVGYTSSLDMPFLIFTGSVLVGLLPLGAAFWLWDRPRRALRNERWREEGRMHDVVRRLSAFLEINPSLPAAVRMARTSLPPDKQYMLGELTWGPFTEGRPFDEKFQEFRERWSCRSPVIGRALGSLISAEREASRAEVVISARSLVSRLSEESKAMMEAYSRSLAGPSTALFGMGVLLPILLATMIPVAGISGRTAVLIGFFLWFILPCCIMLIGSSLVMRRPSLGSDTGVKAAGWSPPGALDLIMITAGVIVLAAALLHLLHEIELPPYLDVVDRNSASVLLVMCGASALLAGVIGWTTRGSYIAGREHDEVRNGSPVFLRELSSSLLEGRSFEFALKRAFSKSKTGVISTFRVLPGATPREASVPEPAVTYLESAEEFSRAGKGPGGKAVRAFSRHVQEMLDLESDLSSRVRSAVGQMEVTASIFAPLMIGASAGIFRLMGSVQEGAPDGMLFGGGARSGMEPWNFLLLSAGYLLVLSMVTTITIHRLEKGTTDGGWHKVPKRLVQSSLTFSLGVITSSLLIG
ncbi:MAG: hypothetical protein ACMUHU_07205 [Thermoplasmatota archaeon]